MAALIGEEEKMFLRQYSFSALLILILLSACTLQIGLERPPSLTATQIVISSPSTPASSGPSPVTETPTPLTATPTATATDGAVETSTPARTPSLAASRPSPTATVTATESCSETWFFEIPVEFYGHCPQPIVVSQAAAQPFERGMMIWIAQPGRYHVLTNQIMFEGELRKLAYRIDDPLDITADTSADYAPPPGLIAPMSGFGLVWRGDVAQSPGFQGSLGWATAPESAYEASYQCEIGSVSGGRTWRFCFLLAPGGDVIVFHALDGWLWLSEWE